jgi:hypothetical protein
VVVIPKNNKKKAIMDERELLKMEIAKELGIWDQIESQGWESLSNEACGRVWNQKSTV